MLKLKKEVFMTSTQWQNLVSESYYETITSIEERIKKYDYSEALIGLEYLYQNMAKKDKREFRTFLELVMMHVLKWKYQPEKRSSSWAKTIRNARKEMQVIREDVPSITQSYINEIWESCFQSAVDDAIYEMSLSKLEKRNFKPDLITQSEVFEKEYYLEDE
jgi:RNase H-fold protein (predicted Holliday junction resolvase)